VNERIGESGPGLKAVLRSHREKGGRERKSATGKRERKGRLMVGKRGGLGGKRVDANLEKKSSSAKKPTGRGSRGERLKGGGGGGQRKQNKAPAKRKQKIDKGCGSTVNRAGKGAQRGGASTDTARLAGSLLLGCSFVGERKGDRMQTSKRRNRTRQNRWKKEKRKRRGIRGCIVFGKRPK